MFSYGLVCYSYWEGAWGLLQLGRSTCSSRWFQGKLLQKKYKTRNEALLAFYGDQPENPPLLQPVSALLLENDGNDNFRLCHSSFILVIAVVIALLVGFFIWKLM